MDGWGGLHPFGNPTPVAIGGPNAYWPGWDIALKIVLNPCQGGNQVTGFIVDGWGGFHPIASSGALPGISGTPPYWPGWRIVRGVVLSGANQGYVLDGWGGVHPFGGAPPVNVSGYWPGWDIARGLVLQPGHASAGWVVDAWGGLHPFGTNSDTPASLQTFVYTPGYSAVVSVIAS